MDIGSLIDTIVQFFSAHTIVAVVILVIVGLLVYAKPKEMAKLAVIVLIAGLLYGVGSMLWDTTFKGVTNKNEMVDTEP